MNPEEALKLVDNVVSQVSMNRESHGQAIRAIEALQGVVAEIRQLRREVGRLNVELEQAHANSGGIEPACYMDDPNPN